MRSLQEQVETDKAAIEALALAHNELDALRAENAAKDATIARLTEALEVADDAINEMFRYYDGGETRGSYDGKPERAQLRKAGYTVRAALASKETGSE